VLAELLDPLLLHRRLRIPRQRNHPHRIARRRKPFCQKGFLPRKPTAILWRRWKWV
jgi:hypothetical protein